MGAWVQLLADRSMMAIRLGHWLSHGEGRLLTAPGCHGSSPPTRLEMSRKGLVLFREVHADQIFISPRLQQVQPECLAQRNQKANEVVLLDGDRCFNSWYILDTSRPTVPSHHDILKYMGLVRKWPTQRNRFLLKQGIALRSCLDINGVFAHLGPHSWMSATSRGLVVCGSVS